MVINITKEDIEKKSEELWKYHGQPCIHDSWLDLSDGVRYFWRYQAKVVLYGQDGYH